MLKLNFFVLFLITIKCVNSKIFTKCELAEELIKNQNLSLVETRKHLCIVRDEINTATIQETYHGIYRISSMWWCGSKGEKSGSCDMKCEDLNDDDITDDVLCASKILDQYGINGWGVSGENCLYILNEFLPKCPLENFQKGEISTTTATKTENSILLSTLFTTTEAITTEIEEEISTIPTTEAIKEEPNMIISYESHKIEPNLVFNIFSFNISGHNHKVEYQL